MALGLQRHERPCWLVLWGLEAEWLHCEHSEPLYHSPALKVACVNGSSVRFLGSSPILTSPFLMSCSQTSGGFREVESGAPRSSLSWPVLCQMLALTNKLFHSYFLLKWKMMLLWIMHSLFILTTPLSRLPSVSIIYVSCLSHFAFHVCDKYLDQKQTGEERVSFSLQLSGKSQQEREMRT